MDKYLVVGRGLVGSIFLDDSHFDVVSHDEWHNRNLDNYSGMVCAAAMSTEAKCLNATMEEVFEANVYLPLRMLKYAMSREIPCVVFSTAGVYRVPHIHGEEDDVSPHNRYTASKIFMESTLMEESYSLLYIYRIPFVVLFSTHPSDFGERIKNWTQVEDVTASIVYRGDIKHATRAAMNGAGDGGIYNIASGSVHFPRFMEDRFNWSGEVVPAHSMTMRSPNSIVNCDKAKQAGLLPQSRMPKGW